MNDSYTAWVAPTPSWRPSAPVALKPVRGSWSQPAPERLPLPQDLGQRFQRACDARGEAPREVLAQLVRSFVIRELAEGRDA